MIVLCDMEEHNRFESGPAYHKETGQVGPSNLLKIGVGPNRPAHREQTVESVPKDLGPACSPRPVF